MLDAIELALIQSLSGALSPREVAVAWRQVRGAMSTRVPGERLDLVFDRQLGLATLVASDQELVNAVQHGRPVQVVQLGKRLREVRDAFGRWAEARPESSGRRAPRRKRVTGSLG
jgi:ribosomal protein L34E